MKLKSCCKRNQITHSLLKSPKKIHQQFITTIRLNQKGAIRLSVFHEIGHYICEDEDDLADYFARHFMCPTAYLMLKGIESPNEIVAFCGVSFQTACNASANIANRKKKLGNKLLSYEKEFIKNIDPITFGFYELTDRGR